jgi:hypothetical protein
VRNYSDLDDADLWELSTEDPEAFGEIFRRHARAVFSICYWRTGDTSVAEDVTSVVFLEAWKRRDSFITNPPSTTPPAPGAAVVNINNTAVDDGQYFSVIEGRVTPLARFVATAKRDWITGLGSDGIAQ